MPHPPREPPTRRWASLDDAAEVFGCSVKTLRRMIASGEVTAYRFGARLLRVDLVEMEDNLRRVPPSGAGR